MDEALKMVRETLSNIEEKLLQENLRFSYVSSSGIEYRFDENPFGRGYEVKIGERVFNDNTISGISLNDLQKIVIDITNNLEEKVLRKAKEILKDINLRLASYISQKR